MTVYLIRRLFHSIFVLIGVSLLVFFVGRMIGDPARLMLPLEASEAQVQALRERLGFDQPIYIQLGRFVADLSRGDFGTSIWQGVPAMSLVVSRFPATVYLTAAVVTFSLCVGLPMGVDVCYTNHVAADQNSADNLLVLLTAAGCNYFMGVPCADDVMLNYQSTSYHDVAGVRRLFGLTPAPEFLAWLEGMGIYRDRQLAFSDGPARRDMLRRLEHVVGSGL